VVPLKALVASVQRDLAQANATSQAAAWPPGLGAISWPAPAFRIRTMQLSVPCLLRQGRGMRSVLELVGDAEAGRIDHRRLVLSLGWSAANGTSLNAVRLDPAGSQAGQASSASGRAVRRSRKMRRRDER
jgi:hypothetical protein